jgi:hypothetical protein
MEVARVYTGKRCLIWICCFYTHVGKTVPSSVAPPELYLVDVIRNLRKMSVLTFLDVDI